MGDAICGAMEKYRVGQLPGHYLAKRENGFLQAHHKQHEATYDIQQTAHHPCRADEGAAQYQKLKGRQHDNHGSDIQQGGGCRIHKQREYPLYQSITHMP